MPFLFVTCSIYLRCSFFLSISNLPNCQDPDQINLPCFSQFPHPGNSSASSCSSGRLSFYYSSNPTMPHFVLVNPTLKKPVSQALNPIKMLFFSCSLCLLLKLQTTSFSNTETTVLLFPRSQHYKLDG